MLKSRKEEQESVKDSRQVVVMGGGKRGDLSWPSSGGGRREGALRMGETALFVCSEGSSRKRNRKQRSEGRSLIYQNPGGRAEGKGAHIPAVIKI